MAKKPYVTRGFFNPVNSCETGWYKFSIRREERYSGRSLEVDCTIADCSRVIDLDFGAWDRKAIRGRRAKVKKFREVINEFCDEMEDSLDWMEELGEE